MRQSASESFEERIQRLHGCKAKYRETVPVTETVQGEVVWDGPVHIFDLIGHPTAEVCYAWPDPTHQRFFAILHADPVVSPLDAVRAAIAEDDRHA